MGCWNGTCGLSQLPITQGEKIKCVVIRNRDTNPEPSGTCYPNAAAFPCSFVFDGIYDDYGSCENPQGAGLEMFVEFFKTELELGNIVIKNDEYNGIPKNLSNEEIIEFLVRDEVLYSGNLMGIIMFHSDIIENLESVEPNIKNDTIKLLNLIKNFDNDSFTERLESIEKKIEKYKNGNPDNLTENEFEDLIEAKILLKDIIRDSMSWSKLSVKNEIARSFSYSTMVDYKTFNQYLPMIKERVDSDFDNLVNSIKDFVLIENAIFLMRKLWIGQSGKGSQSYASEYYKNVFTTGLKILERNENER